MHYCWRGEKKFNKTVFFIYNNRNNKYVEETKGKKKDRIEPRIMNEGKKSLKRYTRNEMTENWFLFSMLNYIEVVWLY